MVLIICSRPMLKRRCVELCWLCSVASVLCTGATGLQVQRERTVQLYVYLELGSAYLVCDCVCSSVLYVLGFLPDLSIALLSQPLVRFAPHIYARRLNRPRKPPVRALLALRRSLDFLSITRAPPGRTQNDLHFLPPSRSRSLTPGRTQMQHPQLRNSKAQLQRTKAHTTGNGTATTLLAARAAVGSLRGWWLAVGSLAVGAAVRPRGRAGVAGS